MITIQEYAEKNSISYEAVRKQVVRYSKELEGHIVKQNRKQLLDDYAEEFLSQKRQQSPIVVYEQAKDEELEEAKLEIDKLKMALLEAQNKLNESQNKVIALQDEKMMLIEEHGKNQLLIELKERSDNELVEAKKRVQELEEETRSYKKTIFGLYKKI